MASNSEGESQLLLPGIPNDVTLDWITPKLAWRDLFVLSTVSRVWRHANRSRQVYAARLRKDSLETLVLIDYAHLKGLAKSTSAPQRRAAQIDGKSSKRKGSKGGRRADRDAGGGGASISGIALCSVRDGSYYELPRIPKVVGGFPKACQFVSLDGKVYVLGGSPSWERCSKGVYVLDLVGQGKWRQCANMIEPRARFECLVLDGKIFVSGRNDSFGAEVYDPKKDTWSRIEGNAILLRFPHRVEHFGEELVLYDRTSFTRGVLEDNGTCDRVRAISIQSERLHNPETQETQFFMAQGKLHRMRRTHWLDDDYFCIEVHSADENTWASLHSFSFDKLPTFDTIIKPMAVLAVNGELLAVVSWYNKKYRWAQLCLLQSKGLGDMTDKIRWRKAFKLGFLLKHQNTNDSFFERNICTCAFRL